MDEAARPYHLVIQPQRGKDGESLLRLWERKTHRLLWERRIMWLKDWNWSKDGRGLVVLSEDAKALFWCEGETPQCFEIRLPKFQGQPPDLDYVWNPAISPDKTRVLFRGGGSGDIDSDVGTLYCWNRKTGRCKELKDSVRKASWLSRTRIRYTQVEFLMPGERFTQGECTV